MDTKETAAGIRVIEVPVFNWFYATNSPVAAPTGVRYTVPGVCAAEALLLRTRHSGVPFVYKPGDRSFSLRMPILCKYGYAPQMIVPEFITTGALAVARSHYTSVVKRSNATNESSSFGSRQGATRREWFPPFQELQRGRGPNDELPQGRR